MQAKLKEILAQNWKPVLSLDSLLCYGEEVARACVSEPVSV